MSVSAGVGGDFSENVNIFRDLVRVQRSRAASESSTSLPGGNQVDGLPPAPSCLHGYPGIILAAISADKSGPTTHGRPRPLTGRAGRVHALTCCIQNPDSGAEDLAPAVNRQPDYRREDS